MTTKKITEISFDNKFHNFGDVIEGEKVSYIFHFTNIGQFNLIIRSVEASCGCTASIFTKKPIGIKEEGTITVTLDTQGKSGYISNHLVVSANIYPEQTVLIINANVGNNSCCAALSPILQKNITFAP